MFSLKPSSIKPEHREKIKQLMPYVNRVRLYLMRIQGLVSKGKYAKYQYRDPDFSQLKNRIFLLLSLARSGTTAVYELFNTNPSIYAYNEILNPGSFFNFYGFLDRCAALGICTSTAEARLRLFKWYIFEEARKHSEPVVVFDIKLEGMHLINKSWQETYWQSQIFDIARHNNMGIVYLYRKNLLERHLSSQKAEVTGSYHSYADGEQKAKAKITLSTEGLLDRFKQITETRDIILKQFHHYPAFLQVFYEELFEQDPATGGQRFRKALVDDLYRVMDISTPFETTPKTRKVSTQKLSEQIANYEEITALLQASDYADLLDS